MSTEILGFFTPWVIYALITALHYFLPGKWIVGYVNGKKSGEKLKYRLNGRLVLFAMVGIWFLLGYMEWLAFDWLYTIRWYSLAGACTFGLIYSLLSVFPYPSTGKSTAADFFLGRIDNPQYLNAKIDAKMWLYLIGAVMLELNVLSFTAHHWLVYGADASPGVLLCAAMLSYFVLDYLSFEKVHLYTYDIFAEKVGFKLGWGCLTFYPYFYAIALWSTVHLPNPGTPVYLLIIYGLIFLTGWTIARGANMQKFYFKTHPYKSFLGFKPEFITDGNKTLLVNGFWGASRHINYLGEILMGTGIALSVGFPTMLWPWLYPLYYVVLLLPRQIDDDKRCAAKYGALWERYISRVKYRIVPYVY
ncbi:MAG: DUF1295 domain-containing protein [Chitinophagales bacterium]